LAGKVWTTDPAGGNLMPVTGGTGREVVLGWTADQRLVYRSDAPVDSVWITSAQGGAPRRAPIDLEGVGRISLAPRQDWIAFAHVGDDGSTVWRVNLDGSGRLQLTRRRGTLVGAGTLPEVAPDGASVLYLLYEQGRPNLWRVPATGGEPVQVITSGSLTLTGDPVAPSPDGQRILVPVFDDQDRRRVAIFRLSDGTLERNLMEMPEVPPPPRWSPDGRSIIFARTEGTVSNLWAQPLDGGAPHQLTRFDSDRIFAFAYSADGRGLAVSRGRQAGDVVLIRNFR
jgi:Tol biopolymer transport system component